MKFLVPMLMVSSLAFGQSASFWPSSVRPATVDAGPDSAVELGIKFTVDVPGTITGIRFYRSAKNTGHHTARLWNASGGSMTYISFTGETSSGWQQVNFATPLKVAANVVYTASYHTNSGHHSQDPYYFNTKRDAGHLHAAVGAGVFRYGSGSFPTQVWHNSNYWVDVVFVPGSSVPPPPTHSASLRWTGSTSPGIVSQKVYRNRTFLKSVAPTIFNYTDATVQAGQTYSYYVTAVANCESVPSNTVTVAIPSP